MNMKQMKSVLPALFRSGVVPYIWGAQGIGKTEGVKQVASKMGLDLVYLTFGAVEDVGDIIGLVDFQGEGDDKTVHHVKPDWFPATGNKVIFIDEFNRAKPQILQAMFPFILEGRLHTHKLPENCYIVVAGNPDSDEFNVTNTDDLALLSRFCHLEFLPDSQEWIDYMTSSKKNASVISFFLENKDLLSAKVDGFQLRDVAKHDRRSATLFSNVLDYNPTLDDDSMQIIACGLLGPEIGVKYSAWAKDFRDKLGGEEILNAFSKSTADKVQRLILDTDVLNHAVEDCLRIVRDKKKMTKSQMRNLESFAVLLPSDLVVKLMNGLFEIGDMDIIKTLGNSKKILKVIADADA